MAPRSDASGGVVLSVETIRPTAILARRSTLKAGVLREPAGLRAAGGGKGCELEQRARHALLGLAATTPAGCHRRRHRSVRRNACHLGIVRKIGGELDRARAKCRGGSTHRLLLLHRAQAVLGCLLQRSRSASARRLVGRAREAACAPAIVEEQRVEGRCVESHFAIQITEGERGRRRGGDRLERRGHLGMSAVCKELAIGVGSGAKAHTDAYNHRGPGVKMKPGVKRNGAKTKIAPKKRGIVSVATQPMCCFKTIRQLFLLSS